jgi:hypothetical protein
LLTVRGGFVKNWKLRWFTLKDGKLSYYKSKAVSFIYFIPELLLLFSRTRSLPESYIWRRQSFSRLQKRPERSILLKFAPRNEIIVSAPVIALLFPVLCSDSRSRCDASLDIDEIYLQKVKLVSSYSLLPCVLWRFNQLFLSEMEDWMQKLSAASSPQLVQPQFGTRIRLAFSPFSKSFIFLQ